MAGRIAKALEGLLPDRGLVEIDGWQGTSSRLLRLVLERDPPRPYTALDAFVEGIHRHHVYLPAPIVAGLYMGWSHQASWSLTLLAAVALLGVSAVALHLRAWRESRLIRTVPRETLTVTVGGAQSFQGQAVTHDGRAVWLEQAFLPRRVLSGLLRTGPADVLVLYDQKQKYYEVVGVRPGAPRELFEGQEYRRRVVRRSLEACNIADAVRVAHVLSGQPLVECDGWLCTSPEILRRVIGQDAADPDQAQAPRRNRMRACWRVLPALVLAAVLMLMYVLGGKQPFREIGQTVVPFVLLGPLFGLSWLGNPDRQAVLRETMLSMAPVTTVTVTRATPGPRGARVETVDGRSLCLDDTHFPGYVLESMAWRGPVEALALHTADDEHWVLLAARPLALDDFALHGDTGE